MRREWYIGLWVVSQNYISYKVCSVSN